jgi:hypothetical protein
MSFRVPHLLITLPFNCEEWERFLQLIDDDAATCLPKLQAVATGFRSFTESSIFTPTSAAIDIDTFSDIDWGFNSGVAIDVSPMRQIKQEKVSDVDVEEETEILKPTRKGKAKAKVDDKAKGKVDEDLATMVDFDAKFHE